MITGNTVIALLFLTFSIVYGLKAREIELYFGDAEAIFTAWTFPNFLAILGGIVALAMLLLPSKGKPSLDAETLVGFDWPRVIALCVAMVAYGLTIMTVGFLNSTTLFLIAGFVILGERHVEPALAGIDPRRLDARLRHLPRPFLSMRTQGSVNHPGPMKSRPRSSSQAAPRAKEWTIRRPAARPGWPSGPGHSSRNSPILQWPANTRSGPKGRVSKKGRARQFTFQPPAIAFFDRTAPAV